MTQPSEADIVAAAEKQRAALHEDYSQFVATANIYYDGALAYVPGHPVPATNVAAHGYEADGLVQRVASASKAAKAAPDAVSSDIPAGSPAAGPTQ